jgi:hypothetical protein
LSQEGVLRIGTWNVEYAYTRRLPAIQAALEQYPADIWILTETHDDLVPMGCPHVAHSLARPKNWNGIRAGSRWVSIWSAFPVVSKILLDDADQERTVVALLDTGTERPVIVYGTVLPWKGDRGVPTWDEHDRVIQQQWREWKTLSDLYPDADLVIAGDYNTDMGTGRRYGTKRGIFDLNQAFSECGLYCATSPQLIPEGTLPYPPIDHIAVPKSWQDRTRLAAAWPADRKVHSDHSGVLIQADIPSSALKREPKIGANVESRP